MQHCAVSPGDDSIRHEWHDIERVQPFFPNIASCEMTHVISETWCVSPVNELPLVEPL